MEQNEEREELLPEPPLTDAAAAIQRLVEERDMLQDRLLRRQAEFENYKKRVERERGELIQSASAELIRELLGVLDSFDLAIRNAASEGTAGEDMLRGLDLVYKQLLDTLGRFGLKVIEVKGQPFDPNWQECRLGHTDLQGVYGGVMRPWVAQKPGRR